MIKKCKYSLTAEERETIIVWNANNIGKIYIYSSQQPMVRRLLCNPLFELKSQAFNYRYKVHPSPISIDGYLPLRALTIRTKLVKRRLTSKQKKELVRRLKHGRESF